MTSASELAALPPKTFTTLRKIRPTGSLQARRETSGAVALFWRYTLSNRSERVRIGLYDPGAPVKALVKTAYGFSIAAAIRAAEGLAIEHHEHLGTGGRPAIVAARLEAERTADEEVRSAKENTLGRLLDAYCDHLETLGRRSHADARSIFRLHVTEKWPALAELPARASSLN